MPALEPECDLLWGLRSDPQLLRPRNASPRAAAVSLSYLSPPGALSCSTGPRGHCPSCSCFLRILLTNRCNTHKSHQSWTPCLLPKVTSFQAASLLTTPTPAPLNPDSPPPPNFTRAANSWFYMPAHVWGTQVGLSQSRGSPPRTRGCSSRSRDSSPAPDSAPPWTPAQAHRIPSPETRN